MFRVKQDPAEYDSKSVRLPVEMIDQLQALADANNISFNSLVEQCVEYALDNLDRSGEA
ncbi:MAG: Arc family DNA-binding protein [Lachnospiraceae bacterium]|nr:Arc family DNA-binding protein [Lachnospiraceae bacterium]